MSQTRQATDPATLRAALGGMPLFHDLDDEDLDRIAATVRTRRYRRGEVIFHQGDPGDALHIVLSGRVKISSPSDTGVEAILATLRPEEFFGALSLLDGAPRSASATAVDATETLILPREQFRRLVNDVPAIRDHVFAGLAHELRRLTNHVEELHFLDIAGRLAARLARLADEQGRATDGEIRLDGPITQGELAAMVGSTRQSVNKLLGWFVDDGLIRIERDAIVIVDLPGAPPGGPPLASGALPEHRQQHGRAVDRGPIGAGRPAQERQPALRVPAVGRHDADVDGGVVARRERAQRQPHVGTAGRADPVGLGEVAGLVARAVARVILDRVAAVHLGPANRLEPAQQADQRPARAGLGRRERPAARVQRLGQRARPGDVAARPDELAQRRDHHGLGGVARSRAARPSSARAEMRTSTASWRA